MQTMKRIFAYFEIEKYIIVDRRSVDREVSATADFRTYTNMCIYITTYKYYTQQNLYILQEALCVK